MDPIVSELREQIAAVDRELVTRLKRHKDEHGIDFVDSERERWLIDHLAETNTGPLSDEGLRAFHAELLALTKREVNR